MIDQACLAEAEDRAAAAYDEPNRHYHDRRHLDDCLSRLGEVGGLADRDRRLLRWALLWHDAVYEPAGSGNEEASAELAERELTGCGVGDDEAREVSRLILLTRGHRVEPGDQLGALLVSIDLSILGSDPDRYGAYVRDIRREYSHVPDDAWKTGRSAVLGHLIGANPLYPDPGFRSRFEDQARRNLAAELKSLG